MTDTNSEVQSAAPTRAPYATPTLTTFGSLADMTKGTGMINNSDSGKAMASNRSA